MYKIVLEEGRRVRPHGVIVVDTGPLVAALDADDADHERCLRVLVHHPVRCWCRYLC